MLWISWPPALGKWLQKACGWARTTSPKVLLKITSCWLFWCLFQEKCINNFPMCHFTAMPYTQPSGSCWLLDSLVWECNWCQFVVSVSRAACQLLLWQTLLMLLDSHFCCSALSTLLLKYGNGTNYGFTVPLRCAGREKYSGPDWLEELRIFPTAGCTSFLSISELTLRCNNGPKHQLEVLQAMKRVSTENKRRQGVAGQDNMYFNPFTISWT